MGVGSTIGSIAGAAIGTAIAPGAGTSLGGMIGGGIGQSIEGGIKSNKSDSSLASESDTNRLRAFEEARRMQRQLETGSDALTQSNLRESEQLTAATQRAIGQNTGGNINATVAGMLSAQKQGGLNNAQSLGLASQRGQYFTTLADTIGKEIAQRKMDMQNLRSARQSAQGAQLQKQGFMNTAAGLAQLDPKTLTDLIAKLKMDQPATGASNVVAPAMSSQNTIPANSGALSKAFAPIQIGTPIYQDPGFVTPSAAPALNTIELLPQ